MGMRLTWPKKVLIVGLFAIGIFGLTTFIVLSYQSTHSVKADSAQAVASQPSPTPASITRLAVAASVTPASSPNESSTASPLVSPAVSPSLDPSASPASVATSQALISPSPAAVGVTSFITPSPVAVTPIALAQTALPTTKYDYRFWLVIGDAGLVFVLLAILLIRIISKVLLQPAMLEPISLQAKPNKPVTLDELNIDIPS